MKIRNLFYLCVFTIGPLLNAADTVNKQSQQPSTSLFQKISTMLGIEAVNEEIKNPQEEIPLKGEVVDLETLNLTPEQEEIAWKKYNNNLQARKKIFPTQKKIETAQKKKNKRGSSYIQISKINESEAPEIENDYDIQSNKSVYSNFPETSKKSIIIYNNTQVALDVLFQNKTLNGKIEALEPNTHKTIMLTGNKIGYNALPQWVIGIDYSLGSNTQSVLLKPIPLTLLNESNKINVIISIDEKGKFTINTTKNN